MSKQKIGAREAVKDIKSGMSDADLMSKYNLSPKGLESLFQKLVQAKLIDESSVRQRSARAPERSKEPLQPSAPSIGAPPPSPEPLSDLTEAVLKDIKAGRHDNEIMRSHELSPGQLKQIKENLAQSGLLVESIGGPPKPKETRLCPTCSEEVDISATECPHCGRWLEPESPAEPKPGMPIHPPAGVVSREESVEEESVQEEKECPWENRESYGTLNAYFQTATKLLTAPVGFFAKLPIAGGYLNPILFAAFSIPVGVVLSYLWIGLFKGSSFGGMFGLLIGMSCAFVSGLIFVPIGLAIWSGLLHLCLLAMGAAREGFEATFRVVAYSTVTTIFNAIPYIGSVVSLWSLVLNVIGLRETHKTTTGKAVAAVAIPLVVGVVFALLLGFTTLASLGLFGGGSKQTCRAVEAYIARVDSAADLDGDAFNAEVQAAIRELAQDLRAQDGGRGNVVIQQKALMFGMASIQAKAGAQLTKGVDELRTDLRKSCK